MAVETKAQSQIAEESPKKVGWIRRAVLAISAILMVIDLYLIFLWVPTEQTLGLSQRIFYFHVPIAWVALLSVIILAIASITYLVTGKEKWDSLAYATAEFGIVVGSLTLLSGMVWAKPIWGVWWTWDARLTTTLILWFILLAYIMVRSYASSGSQGKRYAAVLGVIGALDAPIVYFSTTWWRTAHPEMNLGPLAPSGSLEPQMQLTLMFSVVVFTVLFGYLVSERYNLKQDEKEIDRIYSEHV